MPGHNGRDYAGPIGTSVYATHPGRIETGVDPGGYGNWVRVYATNGAYHTIYGHFERVHVAQNQWVSAGDLLGDMGSTGWSTGPHVHFGLKFTEGRNPAYRNWVDPVPFIAKESQPMTNKIGVHWIPVDPQEEDYRVFQAWTPPIIKIVNPTSGFILRALNAVPRAGFVLRDHSLSEQQDDLRNAPRETGIRHAREMMAHAEEWTGGIVPRERVILLGINEPGVSQHTEGAIARVNEYTVAFLHTLAAGNWRGGALNLSVGWPHNDGPDLPPRWDLYSDVLAAIRAGGHVLVLHEYWSKDGPGVNWGWWAGRYTQCPWDVPIIIGECGCDQDVVDRQPDGRRGWQDWMDGPTYVAQLADYNRRVQQDPRIVAVLPFTYDQHAPWGPFDLRPIQWDVVRMAQSFGIVEPPPISAPLPVPPIQDQIQTAAWDKLGIERHPDWAFFKFAKAKNLGRPVTREFDRGNLRIQGFDGGIVYTVIGDWANVKKVNWL